MITQVFRNRIYESRSFKYRIKKIESFIGANLHKKEPTIIKGVTNLWKSQKPIALKPFRFGGTNYPVRIEFSILPTHGPPYIKVKDKISTSFGQIEYKTEYGDLAFVVDYLFQGRLLKRKTSILQSKKEKHKDKVDIPLHQHYLMEFWPDVEFPSKSKSQFIYKFGFNGVCPDEFSFYHFILNYGANPIYSSSVCSAPLVGLKLGTRIHNIQKSLLNWCNSRKTKPNLRPPSQILSMPLLPGGIYQHGKYYKWNLLTKPFKRFILDASYLHVGSDDRAVFEIARLRVPNVLRLKVVGGRGEEEYIPDDNSRTDAFIFR